LQFSELQPLVSLNADTCHQHEDDSSVAENGHHWFMYVWTQEHAAVLWYCSLTVMLYNYRASVFVVHLL